MDREYFDVVINPVNGVQVITLREDLEAEWEGDRVTLLQGDPQHEYKAISIRLNELLDLAEYIKNN